MPEHIFHLTHFTIPTLLPKLIVNSWYKFTSLWEATLPQCPLKKGQRAKSKIVATTAKHPPDSHSQISRRDWMQLTYLRGEIYFQQPYRISTSCGHCKEIRKLKFWMLAFCQSERIRSDEGLLFETSAFESLYSGQVTLSTQLIKPNYTVSNISFDLMWPCYKSAYSNKRKWWFTLLSSKFLIHTCMLWFKFISSSNFF